MNIKTYGVAESIKNFLVVIRILLMRCSGGGRHPHIQTDIHE
jgi:hypothetical protein